MDWRYSWSIFVFIGFVLCTMSCKSVSNFTDIKTLPKLCNKLKYTPFDLPIKLTESEAIKPGAIVTVNKKNEIQEYVAFKKQFIPDLKYENLPSGLGFSSDNTLYSNSDLELNLIKLLGEKIDIKNALNLSRVQSIRISIEKPFQLVMSKIDITNRLNELNPKSEYHRILKNPNNYIIFQLLCITSFSYSLVDEKGGIIELDMSILENINAAPKIQQYLLGKSKIEIDEPTIIGYRLVNAIHSAAFAGPNYKVKEVDLFNANNM